ncbi:MAG: CopG family transcriptional regulator [Deltaproteobacteria bacterium]|nr:CopG family transcriptional regulator [Deltaproteobacteria bacterium]MBW1815915.1 CopG family transcriptional regulator [Deltaproteobacteria bacterium]
MGQVTIYLEDEIEVKMRSAAKAMNLSQSRWIANIIKEKVADEWPGAVRDLAGAWKDFPSLEDIRHFQESDAHREEL